METRDEQTGSAGKRWVGGLLHLEINAASGLTSKQPSGLARMRRQRAQLLTATNGILEMESGISS